MDSISPLAMRKMDQSAASRQKSCNACVRGKRRCDKRTPRCTRCAAKSLDCVYQKLPSGGTPGGGANVEAGSVPVAGEHPDDLSDLADLDMSFDLYGLSSGSATTATTSASTATTESIESNDPLQFGSNLDFSLIDHLMANSSAAGSELWNLPDYGINKMSIPPIPSPAPLVVRDASHLYQSEQCLSDFNPLDVHDIRSRVGFTVNFISTLHCEFARSRTLPFLHSRLYGTNLPRPMLAAFSAASAYVGRTPENKAWVYKLVADMVRDIHCEGERATTPVEKLARVQALLVLDTIRMFDGDVSLRAASERETKQMTDWIRALNELRVELVNSAGHGDVVGRDQPAPSWENWLFLECVNRTIMMSFAFVCLTHILKSIEPPCEIMETCVSFTASKYLWEADSGVSFLRAWQSKPRFHISEMDFKELWMHAQPEDLDSFTKIFLTAQIGPDAMDQFMLGNLGVAV